MNPTLNLDTSFADDRTVHPHTQAHTVCFVKTDL